MSCSNLCRAVAGVVTLSMLEACGGVTIPPAPPTFLEVQNTAIGIRTGYRADADDAEWSFFSHTDVFDENACGDMAVAPDGIMRSLAVIRPDTEPRARRLVIRTGLGPANWSTTFTDAVIPDTAIGLGNTPQCTNLRMVRMRDGLHAIFWTNQNSDSLFNAVYNADNPQTLNFGTTIRRPERMQQVSPRLFSPVFFDDQVHLIWRDNAGERINTLRGTVTANGVTFVGGVSFTALPNLEISDAVVSDGALFIAVRTANALELHRKTAGNLNFVQHATCPNPRPLRGRLLFRDAANVFWVSESALPENSTNVRLRSMSDCSTRTIVHPLAIGQLYFHPGRP